MYDGEFLNDHFAIIKILKNQHEMHIINNAPMSYTNNDKIDELYLCN